METEVKEVQDVAEDEVAVEVVAVVDTKPKKFNLSKKGN